MSQTSNNKVANPHTPETDENVIDAAHNVAGQIEREPMVSAVFARRMERERDEARRAAELLRDCLHSNGGGFTWEDFPWESEPKATALAKVCCELTDAHKGIREAAEILSAFINDEGCMDAALSWMARHTTLPSQPKTCQTN